MRKIVYLVLGLCMIFIMTGCSGSIPADVISDFEKALEERARANIDAATELHTAGLFTDEQYSLIVTSINVNYNKIKDGLESSDNTSELLNLLTSVTDWQIVPNNDTLNPHIYDEDDNDLGPGKGTEEYAHQFLTNSVALEVMDGRNMPALASGSIPITHVGGRVNPLVFVDADASGNINEIAGFPIQVLNTNFDNQGLDEIVEAIKEGVENGNEELLQRYFHGVEYTRINRNASGVELSRSTVPLTLIDVTQPENKLIRPTIGGCVDSDGVYQLEEGRGQPHSIYYGENGCVYNNMHNYHELGAGHSNTPSSANDNSAYPTTPVPLTGMYRDPRIGGSNRLGCDMIYRSPVGGYELMSVRLIEFNADTIQKIKDKFGLTEKKYHILNNKVYIMEYPVGYIEGFKETDDRTGYNSIIKQSQLSINLVTGDMFKSKLNADGSIDYASSVKITNEDPYYTLNGALSADEESLASFVVHGETGITVEGVTEDLLNPVWNLRYGDILDPVDNQKGVRVSVGRIVLRDYLEATYAPNIIQGERLIVLGRKLRVLNLSGNKQSQGMAKFYGIDGNQLPNSATLYISDFADIPSVMQNIPTLSYISASQEPFGAIGVSSGITRDSDSDSGDSSDEDVSLLSVDPDNPDSTDIEPSDDTGDSLDTGDSGETGEDTGSLSVSILQGSLSRIDGLPKVIVSEVHMSTMFPGTYIDSSEVNYTDNRPLFYTMFVKKNMFESGLFSDWVNASDSTSNSVAWWNSWLGTHGFNYSINSDSLVAFLEGNYQYELSRSGIIVLDLRTIAHIQEDMNAESRFAVAKGIRTMFIILGAVLTVYSFILLVAWNVDVNVDLGFNFLEKFTLGHWVAVRTTDELPEINGDETKYLSFSTLLSSCLVIMGLGLVLILVDVMEIVLVLIDMISGIFTAFR